MDTRHNSTSVHNQTKEAVKYFSIDLETTGLDFTKDSVLGIGIYTPDQQYYLQCPTQIEDAREIIARYIRQGYKAVTHNGAFDYKFLKKLDITLNISFDTKIAICLLGDRPATSELEAAASFYLKKVAWKSDVLRKTLIYEDPKRIAEYCLLDCQATYELVPILLDKLNLECQKDFYFKKLLPLYKLLTKASYTGITIDTSLVEHKIAEYEANLSATYNQLRTDFINIIKPFEDLQLQAKLATKKKETAKARVLANPPRINFESPKQLYSLLHDYAGLDPRDREGKPSTNTDALYYLSHSPLVMQLIKCRDLDKPIQFFKQWLEVKDKTNAIHTTFNVDVTRTGRLSSSEPNLQQIPVRKDPSIRHCFIPRPEHKLIINDLSNIEPRFIAHYSQDDALVQLYQEGWSLYGVAAQKMGLWDGEPNQLKAANKHLYNVAKTIVLAMFYNMGARKLAFQLRKDADADYTEKQCRNFIDLFFNGFPGIADLKNKVERAAIKKGFVKNFFGRHVYVPKERAYMTALNSLIQSSASDYMCFLQLELSKVLDPKAQLLLLIHDEMIWECPTNIASIVLRNTLDTNAKMWHDLGIRVPIELEGGIFSAWGKASNT